METKFTDGPWRYSKSNGDIISMASCEGSDVICDTSNSIHTPPVLVSPDNAHLLAAAPCLYIALQDMVDDYDRWLLIDGNNPDEAVEPLYHAARAALAKARGES